MRLAHQPFLAVACLLAARAAGHGFLAEPAARNVLANSNYCPQCLNAGGPGSVDAGGQTWPAGSHGLCGDPFVDPVPRQHEAGGANVPEPRKITGVYSEGQVVTFKTTLTAFHMGRLGFRICKIDGTSADEERSQLTEQCLSLNQLTQANVPGAQAPGDAWYHLGTVGHPNYTAAYQLPGGLSCDGVTSCCVLQWYYLTGNSCTPPNEPRKYTTGATGTCGVNSAYPEEFWNCADIVITPITPASANPSSAASPHPLSPPTASPRSTPSPKASLSPRPTAQSAAAFCAAKGKAGWFADPSSGCSKYYRCEATGSWRLSCPSTLLFNEGATACDYAANVACPRA